MKRLKKSILFIHRWLGLISGLVVFIVSLTGCIFCFQDEIQDAIHTWRHVQALHQPYEKPSVLKKAALSHFPEADADYIYYFGQNRPALVLVITRAQEYVDVYLDPYSARITHIENVKSNFFTIIEYIHLYLLLPAAIGKWVVGISVIVFVALMLTGIILWWPRRKTDCKRSFTIKWNGRWRRINYDLHNVLGFYATAIALILAVTGLSITFDFVHEGIYHTANLGRNYTSENAQPQSKPTNGPGNGLLPVDAAFAQAQRYSPQAEMFLISDIPGKTTTIDITAYARSLHYGNSDSYTFDRYSGQLLKRLPESRKSPGMKLNDLNYDIHVGQALGLTGKIIAFLASLICASLPVTGLVIWLGKRRKSSGSKVKRTERHLRQYRGNHRKG